MTQLLLPILTRTIRALAKGPLGPAMTVLTQLHADRTRRLAHGPVVDDGPGADDGFCV